MTAVYVGPVPLVGLGGIGRLDLLDALPDTPLVPLTVREQVTTEPARTNLRQLLDRGGARTDIPGDGGYDDAARATLGEPATTADVRLVAAVLEHGDTVAGVWLVSDDRRVRTVARGLGAEVTGTVGLLVRAVEQGLPPGEARGLLRDLDDHGLHATGRFLEAADELIGEAGAGAEDHGRRPGRHRRGPPGRQ